MANASGQRPTAVEYQENYTTLIDYASGANPVYIGKAQIGSATSASSWAIKKLTYDGNDNPTSIKWADGTETFNKVWDDRTGFTYT